jgi:hypothetical protein
MMPLEVLNKPGKLTDQRIADHHADAAEAPSPRRRSPGSAGRSAASGMPSTL